MRMAPIGRIPGGANDPDRCAIWFAAPVKTVLFDPFLSTGA
jgi:hypothetical protein